MRPLITVIIPAYNVEKYIQICIASIVEQTYENLEIIIVDDGSTDLSGEICDIIASKDSRVTVIHQANGGLSTARNAGMRLAKGEMLAFVDSDDWIEPWTISEAYNAIQGVDIVIWGYSADFVDNNGKVKKQIIHAVDGVCSIGKHDILTQDFSLGLIGYAWNKLYKTKLIKNTNFPDGISLVEDILFNEKILCKCNRIRFISNAGTHYMQRSSETLGNKYYSDYYGLKLSACHSRKRILQHFGYNKEEIKCILSSAYLSAVKGQIKNINRLDISYGQKLIQINGFLSRREVKQVLFDIEPSGIKEIIIYYLLKWKSITFLMWILKK